MTATESYEQIFRRSVETVLEAMFFESLSGEPETAGGLPAGCLVGAVSFDGTRCGRMLVAMERATAATLAGNFLGLGDEESAPLEESTLQELANISCGSFLSRLDPHGSFCIGAPEMLPATIAGTEERDWLLLPLECGAVWFCLEL